MTRSSLAHIAGIGAIVLLAVLFLAEFIYADQHEYDGVSEQAVSFAARMGVVHGGCANEECSGLRGGKPVSYYCTRSGCAFEAEKNP